MTDEQIKTDPDIVQRLRSGYIPETMAEAADEIERLREDARQKTLDHITTIGESMEAQVEIGRLQSECQKLANYLMHELVFVHEKLIEEIDVSLEPYLGG